jgi:hypothetical protein
LLQSRQSSAKQRELALTGRWPRDCMPTHDEDADACEATHLPVHNRSLDGPHYFRRQHVHFGLGRRVWPDAPLGPWTLQEATANAWRASDLTSFDRQRGNVVRHAARITSVRDVPGHHQGRGDRPWTVRLRHHCRCSEAVQGRGVFGCCEENERAVLIPQMSRNFPTGGEARASVFYKRQRQRKVPR